MLSIFRNLLDSLQVPRRESGNAEFEHTLELVTAVLMVEVIRADGSVQESERDAVLGLLRQRFSLSEAELSDLFELAHHHSEHAHDLFSFTQRLNQSLDEPQRVRIFELLWQAAYADGRADAHEVHLLRRLADLLHIRQADAINAKLRAEQAAR